MLRSPLRMFSILMVSLLIISCASQKPITSFTAPDLNSGLNSGQPARQFDNLVAEKPIDAPLSQTVEIVEKEAMPVKAVGTSMDSPSASKTVPAPEKISISLNVQFDTGKANIKPMYHPDIKRMADFMSKYPSASAVIEGHTDNVGNKAFNVKLSQRRADNIKAYLAETLGIDRSRIKAKGYHDQKPIASNKTSQGRQKNRRAEGRIVTTGLQSRLYSFFEDSDLPKGGFSIVNQETIDEKIKSFKEKQGVAFYLANIVNGPTLELYKMWGGTFSHCAIRIETNTPSFYQVELQTLPDLQKAGMKSFHKIGAAIDLLGVNQDQFDVVEFTDKNERKKLDHFEPPYATMPICIDNKASRQTIPWYQDCLSRYAGSYNPENARKAGIPVKVFNYNPPVHNCCNFAEEVLEACGLAHCFDLGKSTGLHSKTGLLEE